MASTFFGLSIGTSGLYTYQAALNVTGHNASNAETVGYTRQLINQQASKPISVYSSFGMIGTGVEATSITQVRNNYYDTKYRTNTAIAGMYSTKEHYMVEIENYFNEIENDGFMTNLTKLGESLQELTKDTTSNAVRTQITQYGSSLTEYISYMAKSLNSIQDEANTEIKNTCDRINSLAEQIAMLTKQINTMEVGGATACDLRDSRNNLVDELSQYANISVEENVIGNGVGKTSYVIKLNGKILVNTNEYNSLQVQPKATKDNMNDIDGLYEVNWSDGQEFDLSSPTLGGNLQALFQVRDGNNGLNFNGKVEAQTGNVITLTGANINDELLLNIPQAGKITIGNKEVTYDSFTFKKTDAGYEYQFSLSGESATDNFVGQRANIGNIVSYKGIPYYQNQLNEFARTLAKSFNAIHQEGTNLNGTNGLDFFTGVNSVTGGDYSFYHKGDEINSSNSYYQLTALNFNINQEIKKDPNNIATARELTDGVEKADILQELVACLSDKSMFKEGSPETFLESLIADIAIDTKKSEDFSTSQQNILKAIDNQRLSVSGVDVDEEAMNLIRYQNAYNLSAKVISVMDEIYDRLINYMGV